ncbi:MAG TPA: DUF4330 domain-containing protein [Clostridiaceae bacterium]|nr:DUF4330 domain-containing protein [Clostridiaceae bacterium]
MIISKEGKLFGKISIVDILVLLVIIAAVAGASYKFAKSSTASPIFSKQEDNIRIQFYQPEVPEFIAKAVKIGDPAREALQGTSFGTVSDIVIGESVSWGADENGNSVKSSKEGYVSVLITMDAKGIIGDNGVTIGKSIYHVGETITLYAGNAGFYSSYSPGRISDISIKE